MGWQDPDVQTDFSEVEEVRMAYGERQRVNGLIKHRQKQGGKDG